MGEAYVPTPVELQATRYNVEGFKLSGDGVFATLQGEGVSAGRPSVFARLQNCNLHCGRDGEGWLCDTWYTWDTRTAEYWQGTRVVGVSELAGEIEASWDKNFADMDLQPNLVITGGEPLMQQPKILELLEEMPDWHVEIETNGTIAPKPSLGKAQINCSPKLESSGNSLIARRRLVALEAISKIPDHWFKFVIAQEADVEEVVELMGLINGGNFDRVLLMAEGSDAEQLMQGELKLRLIAGQLGCMVTSRNHIFWFGDKRGT